MKIFRIFCAILLAFSISFTAIIGINKIGENKKITAQKNYKGIISLWQIDSFEGGIGSRQKFLLGVASKFEKREQGVLIMVSNYTIEGANQNIKKGILPDIISFGGGINISPLNELTVEASSGGRIGNKSYATAWCYGSYFLISNVEKDIKNIDKLTVSQAEYTLPLIALLQSELRANEYTVIPPKQAFSDFINGKTKFLLGTQRDIYRLQGKSINYNAVQLNGFSDVNQYVAITAKDEEKIFFANKFINYLLSSEIQSKVSDIGMLSYNQKNEYDIETLNLAQNNKIQSTISAYTLPETLKELQISSLNAVMGNKEEEIKIKNCLVNS